MFTQVEQIITKLVLSGGLDSFLRTKPRGGADQMIFTSKSAIFGWLQKLSCEYSLLLNKSDNKLRLAMLLECVNIKNFKVKFKHILIFYLCLFSCVNIGENESHLVIKHNLKKRVVGLLVVYQKR